MASSSDVLDCQETVDQFFPISREINEFIRRLQCCIFNRCELPSPSHIDSTKRRLNESQVSQTRENSQFKIKTPHVPQSSDQMKTKIILARSGSFR
jgi:hypothetical protein